MLAAAEAGLLVDEPTPNEVKQAVCGNGAADKGQVAAMVARLLGVAHRRRARRCDRCAGGGDRVRLSRSQLRSPGGCPVIGSLRGPVTHVGQEYVLVELGGVGYRVVAGPSLLATPAAWERGAHLRPPPRARGSAGALRLRLAGGARLLRAADDRHRGRAAPGAGDHQRPCGDQAPAGDRHRRRRPAHLGERRGAQDGAAHHPGAEGEDPRRRDRSGRRERAPTRTSSRPSSRWATRPRRLVVPPARWPASEDGLDLRIKAALQELARYR